MVGDFDSSIPVARTLVFRETAPSERECALDEFERRFARGQTSFELTIFHRFEYLAETRPWRISSGNQVVARDHLGRANLLRRNLSELLLEQLICAEIAMTGQAVGAVQSQMFIEAGQAQKLFQSRLFHPRDLTEAHVIVDQGKHLVRIVMGEAQALADFFRDLDADIHMVIETDAK